MTAETKERSEMRVAIIGAGRAGRPLGIMLRAKGHGVIFGVRDPRRSFEIETNNVGGAIVSKSEQEGSRTEFQ